MTYDQFKKEIKTATYTNIDRAVLDQAIEIVQEDLADSISDRQFTFTLFVVYSTLILISTTK